MYRRLGVLLHIEDLEFFFRRRSGGLLCIEDDPENLLFVEEEPGGNLCIKEDPRGLFCIKEEPGGLLCLE